MKETTEIVQNGLGIAKGISDYGMSISVPNNWSWTNNLGISLGYAYNADNRYMKGNLYSLLLYDEALNDMEIHHNYMVDKVKYLIPN